jgi:hypothetical protein
VSAQKIDFGRVKSDPNFGDVRKQHPERPPRETKSPEPQPKPFQKSKQQIPTDGETQRALGALEREILRIERPTHSDTDMPVNEVRAHIGSRFFLIGLSGLDDSGIFKDPTGRTPATLIASENLGRTYAILSKAVGIMNKPGTSPEDLRFLWDEAGKAMEGAELQVIVSDLPRQPSDAKIKRFQQLISEIQQGHKQLTEKAEARENFESKLDELNKKINARSKDLNNPPTDADPRSTAELQKELEATEGPYKISVREEAKAKEALQEKIKTVFVIVKEDGK